MKILTGGIIASLLGLAGLIGWWQEFVAILQGAIPPLLLVGGLIAIYAGITSVKDEIATRREEEIRRIEEIEEAKKKEEPKKKEGGKRNKVAGKKTVRKKAVKEEK